jgi:hypothetical protein
MVITVIIVVVVLSIIGIESIPCPIGIIKIVVHHTRVIPRTTPATVKSNTPTVETSVPTPRAVGIRTTPLIPTVPAIPTAPTAVRPVIVKSYHVDRRTRQIIGIIKIHIGVKWIVIIRYHRTIMEPTNPRAILIRIIILVIIIARLIIYRGQPTLTVAV